MFTHNQRRGLAVADERLLINTPKAVSASPHWDSIDPCSRVVPVCLTRASCLQRESEVRLLAQARIRCEPYHP